MARTGTTGSDDRGGATATPHPEAKTTPAASDGGERAVRVPVGAVDLDGDLGIPEGATGLVLFAHGSGSSRKSPRNRWVARTLRDAGFATLLIDLLTREEEAVDDRTLHLRFDIGLLADRLVAITDWLAERSETRNLHAGYFGSSTGAGAALVAAAQRPDGWAVVSRGGRPDLAGPALEQVKAPTLLIVGGADAPVLDLNRQALARLRLVDKSLEVVPGATHLFQEPGALEEVARLATEWFEHHLTP